MTALLTEDQGTALAVTRTTRVILIAHGSPDARHARSVATLAGRLRSRLGVDVVPAYLEHDDPEAADLMAAPAPPTVGHTIVLPLLLTAGFHWFHDIPVVLAHDGHTSALLAPPEPALFAPAIEQNLGSAKHVVLASAGSARPEIVQRFDALAQALPGRRVDVALTPGAVADYAGPWTTVVPVLAADGVFGDRVRAAAASAGASVTPVLGDTVEFATALAELIRSGPGDQCPPD